MIDRREWPPPFEWSQHGPVPVEIVQNLIDPEAGPGRLAGMFSPYERVIQLDSELPDRPMRVVLHHEWLHMALHDAGIQLPDDTEETLVHALATALVAREDFHAAGGVVEADPTVKQSTRRKSTQRPAKSK
jgi:hypothetical protein